MSANQSFFDVRINFRNYQCQGFINNENWNRILDLLELAYHKLRLHVALMLLDQQYIVLLNVSGKQKQLLLPISGQARVTSQRQDNYILQCHLRDHF